MTETYTIRFMEYEYYDITRDEDMVRLQAITNHGTFFSDVPLVSPASVRIRRESFKSTVTQMISLGQNPQEVVIG